MSDDRKKLRFVGFQQDKREKLTEIPKERDPIVLSNCSMKKARSGDSLMLIIHDKTQINKSPKKFELVLVEDTSVSEELSLSQLEDQVPWQRVTIKAKVLEIGDASKLDDGHQVQQVVADNTDNVEVALWQEFVEALQVNPIS